MRKLVALIKMQLLAAAQSLELPEIANVYFNAESEFSDYLQEIYGEVGKLIDYTDAKV